MNFMEFITLHQSEIYSSILTVFLSLTSFLVIYLRTKSKRIQSIANDCIKTHVDDVKLSDYEVSIDHIHYYDLSTLDIRRKEK